MADEQLALTLDDYQDLALTTWKRTPGDQVDDLAYLALLRARYPAGFVQRWGSNGRVGAR